VKRALFALSIALLPACQEYHGPPEASLAGATNGLLPEPKAPIVVLFSKPVDPATLKLEIAPYVVDDEGNLPDERGNTSTQNSLNALFSTDPKGGDMGGMSTLSNDGKRLTITPTAALPAGAPLVLLLEPGLSDKAGDATRVRKRIVFGYELDVKCDAPSVVFPSGTYFMLAAVKQPIPTQVRLFMAIEVDPLTGAFLGQFTKADRNPDPNRCPTPCDPSGSTPVCELFPGPPKCVAKSQQAGSVDEFPDYVPAPDPPTGYSFAVKGCVVDTDAKRATFATAPVDVGAQMPPVTLRNLTLKALFTQGDDGVLRATGSLSADDVLIGVTPSGVAAGDVTARSIPGDQVPPGLPQPMQQ
jgi:hypothetical protein